MPIWVGPTKRERVQGRLCRRPEPVRRYDLVGGDDFTTNRKRRDEALGIMRHCSKAGSDRRKMSCSSQKDRRGRPARIVLGDLMQEMVKLLPEPRELGA
jgi:hypothetical protein